MPDSAEPGGLIFFYKDCNGGLNGLMYIIKTKILINATNCKADYFLIGIKSLLKCLFNAA